jgi:hypothetical protein
MMEAQAENDNPQRRHRMLSTEAFWNQVAAYNELTWPLAVLMTAAAAFLTYRVFRRPGSTTDAWTKAFLSFAFAWNGIAFFLVYVRNPISTFIGAPLFLIISLLFVLDIRTKNTRFQPPKASWKKALTLLWLALVVLYPLIGLALGHVFPKALLPLFPCPLTVFAIALVAAAAPKVDTKVYVLLLPWALMGLPKCFGAMDCYEDCILFAAGVYGLVELIRNWKRQPGEAHEAPRLEKRATS